MSNGAEEELLEFRKIWMLDMRCLSQDEINQAVLLSNGNIDSSTTDLPIPRIDRTFFNESAGSRRQTYSKVKFARRAAAGNLSLHRQERSRDFSVDYKERSQIVAILKGIFVTNDISSVSQIEKTGNLLENSVPPSSLQIPSASKNINDDRFLLENKNNDVKDVFLSIKNASNIEDKNDEGMVLSPRVQMDRNLRIRNKRLRTKEKARLKDRLIPEQNSSDVGNVNSVSDSTHMDASSKNVDTGFGHLNGSSKTVVLSNGNLFLPDDKVEIEIAEKNNVGEEICTTKEPFMPKAKRKFPQLESEADVQRFFESVGGTWASKRMRRKVVDAEDFFEGFPQGWKVLLGIRKKEDKFAIECRKYISPDGLNFASYREISAHLSCAPKCSIAETTQKVSNSIMETDHEHSVGLFNAEFVSESVDNLSESLADNNHNYQTQINSKLDSRTLDEHVCVSTLYKSPCHTAETIHGCDKHTSVYVGSLENTAHSDVEFINFNVPHCISKESAQRDICIETNSNTNQVATMSDVSLGCSKCDVTCNPDGEEIVLPNIDNVKSISDGMTIKNGKCNLTGHLSADAQDFKCDQTGMESNVISLNDASANRLEENIPPDLKLRNLSSKPTNIEGMVASGVASYLSSFSEEKNPVPISGGELLSSLEAIPEKGNNKSFSQNQNFEDLNGIDQFDYTQFSNFTFDSTISNSALDEQVDLGIDTGLLQEEISPPGQFDW